jgi:hypothetical protein
MKRLKIRLALVLTTAAIVSAGLSTTAKADVRHSVPAYTPAVCAGIKLIDLGICA